MSNFYNEIITVRMRTSADGLYPLSLVTFLPTILHNRKASYHNEFITKYESKPSSLKSEVTWSPETFVSTYYFTQYKIPEYRNLNNPLPHKTCMTRDITVIRLVMNCKIGVQFSPKKPRFSPPARQDDLCGDLPANQDYIFFHFD